MQRLVEFPLQTGGTVVVQVDDPADGSGEPTRGWGNRDVRVVEQAQQSFERAVDTVQPAIRGLVERLRTVADTPQEIQVEFGLQMSAEVGAFVAGASTSGNFKVSVKWTRHAGPDTG